MKVEALTAEDELELAAQLALVRQWCGLPPDGALTASALDDLSEALGLQLEDHELEAAVAPFAAALGELVARPTGLAWRRVTEERGPARALYGEVGEVVIDPANHVRRAWSRGERRFVARLLPVLVANVRAMRG